MKIWLDDERQAPDDTYAHFVKAEDLLDFISNALGGDLSSVAEIDLDHDLGNGMNGYEFLNTIIRMTIDGRISGAHKPKWRIHTANPVGRFNMERAIRELTALKPS